MQTDVAKSGVDELKVHKILAGFTLPSEIESTETSFGLDSTGDPAAWIIFHVKPKVKVQPEDLRRLNQLLEDITSALLMADIGGFPYTRLEQAA